jgi:hypothetical protein
LAGRCVSLCNGVEHLNDWLYGVAGRAVSNWTVVIRHSSIKSHTNLCKTGEFMTTSPLKKYLVLYLVPAHVLASWAKTDPATRNAAEQKMQSDWQRWMSDHAKMITLTEAGGKTKAVTSGGTRDFKNDIMLYSIVEAENHDIAAKAFANHPHLTIPESSIEVMEVRAMGPH